MNIKVNREKKLPYDSYEVTLDDNIIGSGFDWGPEGNEYHINFNYEILKLSSEYNINELFKYNIGSFQLPIDINLFKNLNWLDVEQSSFWVDWELSCTLYFKPNFLNWNKSVNILTFKTALQKNLNNEEITLMDDSDIFEEGLILNLKIDFNKSINNEYQRVLNLIDVESEKIFLKNEQDRNITNIFSFPLEIRSACEQYLVYFTKFLEDLGIEVTSKLNSQEGKTLFTVIPKNSEEALSNIKELLNIYLKIPETNDAEIISSNYSDISVQQLIANVYHLKSQLILSNSIIQNKDATIESLKFTNYQQSLIINSNLNLNEEKTLNGLVTLTEYEGKGFKINLAEIFRRLKREFKK